VRSFFSLLLFYLRHLTATAAQLRSLGHHAPGVFSLHDSSFDNSAALAFLAQFPHLRNVFLPKGWSISGLRYLAAAAAQLQSLDAIDDGVFDLQNCEFDDGAALECLAQFPHLRRVYLPTGWAVA
jgi:hypothetical protein